MPPRIEGSSYCTLSHSDNNIFSTFFLDVHHPNMREVGSAPGEHAGSSHTVRCVCMVRTALAFQLKAAAYNLRLLIVLKRAAWPTSGRRSNRIVIALPAARIGQIPPDGKMASSFLANNVGVWDVDSVCEAPPRVRHANFI